LLLGRAMLLTRPSFTGSWLAMKTMGIVVVAALAAKGPRVHRGRATELNSRQFGVLRAEAALNAASTFHRSAVVDRVNVKSMSLFMAYVGLWHFTSERAACFYVRFRAQFGSRWMWRPCPLRRE